MVIPREKKLVRLYIQLTTTGGDGEGKKYDRSRISPKVILESAQRFMALGQDRSPGVVIG
jgi:phenol 2-monooxygenase